MKKTHNPLPAISSRRGNGMGKAGKTKEMVEERLCKTVASENVICERAVCDRVVHVTRVRLELRV